MQKTTDEHSKRCSTSSPRAVPHGTRSLRYIRVRAKREIAEGRRVMRKIVNITSISGTDGNPGQAGYSSGKAG